MRLRVFYDGDCPFCERYTTLLSLREAVGEVELVNLRTDIRTKEELQSQGFDLDQGMVLEYGGKRVSGAEAMHVIAQLSVGGTLPARAVNALFSSLRTAGFLYPFLRAGRNLTLFAMGRKQISTSSVAGRSLFEVFSHAWGFFAFLHLLFYIYYDAAGTRVHWTTWIIGGLGTFLIFRPNSVRIFTLVTLLMFWDAWDQMPVHSNHTILQNFTLLGMALAATCSLARGSGITEFIYIFAPLGRSLLAIMYIFGVFHKINSGFLDPNVSCAVALWETMPEPLPRIGGYWFHMLAIYGTIIGESAILVGLLWRRTRHIAILIAIAFHSILGLSGYGLYAAFSTLTIALHLLFLTPASADRLVKSSQWVGNLFPTGRPSACIFSIAWLAGLWMLTKSGNATSVGLLWIPWSCWILYLISKFGRSPSDAEPMAGSLLLTWPQLLNSLSVLFFLNCFSPYLGLKTSQSMNMFANLAIEGGYNNHLILSSAPGPFRYLDYIIRPVSGNSPGMFRYAVANGLYLTYYDLLNILERDRNAVVSFERNGVLHTGASFKTLQSDIQNLLHPRWFRNWFLFRPIDMRVPKPCSISQ